MKTLSDIRSAFLDSFAAKGHTVVPSASLLPHNDPTLMFTAAGMVPFKDYFTGKATAPYGRATSAQKCVRAGGKHNDLENVGYTARHHTFFEMMGNFSFGDYFKEDAISFAWDVIRNVFEMDRSRLLVTVYHTDEEAVNLWKKIAGFSDDRIIRIATDDNFWSAGDTGPCGPSSEIFFDQGDHVAGGPPGSADEDGDRYLEFWNLVFMQYDQVNGERVPLPRPSIDTGMGLERMTAILQGKTSNYDIDLFQTIIGEIMERTSTAQQGECAISQRVIADHLRASAFLIADGVLPSNEGRGYVLRRIMRRAMRHAHLLGAKEPLMAQLVPVLVSLMGNSHPELQQAQALITDTLYREENRFRETLARGLRLLEDEVAKLPQGGTLSGEIAFRLYDTYGFPLDLTADILRRTGYGLDHAGFDAAMNRQQDLARASWTGSGDATTEKIWFDLLEKNGATRFDGYDALQTDTEIVALVRDGAVIDQVQQGDTVAVILSHTPFYAESGGQIGDSGILQGKDGARIEIAATRKPVSGLFVHQGIVQSGTLRTGDTVLAQVDAPRRRKLQAHHSATHLLHEALRQHLGDHIAQKGSLVEPDRLRLDFSHPEPLTEDQMTAITATVRAQIEGNYPVETRVMSLDDARASGARALFGEKYGDEVRVVGMGEKDDNGRAWSTELCGGTHVATTGEIGAFRLVAENGVAAGVRRIQAIVGAEAEALAEKDRAALQQMAVLLKTVVEDVPERVRKLLDENHTMSSEIGTLRKKVALAGSGEAGSADAAEQVGAVRFLARTFDDLPAKDLKPLADQFKKQLGSGVVVLLTRAEGRASMVVGVTEDLVSRVNAVDLVRVGAQALGGKGGGGRADMAQAGGPDAAATDKAVQDIRQTLAAVA